MQETAITPILSQINPVHTYLSHFLNMNFNTVLPFMLRSSKWSLSTKFSYQNFVYISFPLPDSRIP